MSDEKATLPGAQLAIVPEQMQVPAVYVNHFVILGSSGFLRLAMGETADSKNFAFRAAYLLDFNSAKALAKSLTDTIAQVEAAQAAATAQAQAKIAQ
jgi:hypothetical protein